MNKLILCVFVAVYVVAVQSFILDDLLGHSPNGGHLGRCHTDADCNGGCCLSVKGALFNHFECKSYYLPGAACDASASSMDCGCMPGYQCDAHLPGSIAVEPSSHLKGSCMPVNGTVSGPQIAVEGGR